MNKLFISITLFLFIISITSCSLTENDSENFIFSIKVVDSNGEPMEGIEIQVRNKLNPALNLNSKASTNIVYSIANDCKLDIVTTDLNDQIIYSVYDSLSLPGLYTLSPNLEKLPNGEPILGDCNIFKCKLLAKSLNL